MLKSFILKPWLGLKTSVPPDDPTLFQQLNDYTVVAHCVGGENIDFQRTRNACSKSKGKSEWSNTAITSAVQCLGLFYLKDGTNTARWIFDGTASSGRVYRYDGSRDPQRICDTASCLSSPVDFASSAMDLYSAIRVGAYMVFSDYGEHTPYCSDHDDTTLSKLISSGTEYAGKYLEYFANRILIAYVTSGVTVGDISVIWSDANPTPASSCTFGSGDPPSNHLYKPDDDTITGIKNMGRNSCFLYGENSIDSIDYYPNYSTPFGIRSVVTGQGTTGHHSVVNVGGRHYLYNKNYGFCMFDGSPNFPAGGRPLSEPIEDLIATINEDYAGWISGEYIPFQNEIAWTVPLEGSSTPTDILYFHVLNGTWRRESKIAYFIDTQPVSDDVTWTKLTTELGYTTWEDLGNLAWADLVQTASKVMFGKDDGKLYYIGTEADDGSDFDGYRIEPVLDFFRPNDKDMISEIWFNLAEVGSYSLYCYYRGGDTVGETKSADWTALTEMSADSPATARFLMNNSTMKANRFHQIKWGTDGADEPFSVSSIEFKYAEQGRY